MVGGYPNLLFKWAASSYDKQLSGEISKTHSKTAHFIVFERNMCF